MARECGITINHAEFEAEMEQQKKRAREAHKSIDIIVSEDEHSVDSTEFCGLSIQTSSILLQHARI